MDKTIPVLGFTHFTIEGVEGVSSSLPPEGLPFGAPQLAGDLGFFAGHRVVRFISRGAMGAVYEAVDVALQRTVALKIVLPHLAQTANGRNQFLNEARAVAKLAHPCVVRIYGTGIEKEMPYLTMEYLQGLTLEQYIRAHAPIAIAEVVQIARSIAFGLQAAHAHDIVHRDIKPENIWLECREPHTIERVVLLDFGLAISATAQARRGKALVGTPNYFSPEGALGLPTSPPSDMFSFGCILYRLLTNQMPFSSSTIVGLLNRIVECAPTTVRQINEQVPEALATLVDQLLAKNPAVRPTATAVVEALQPLDTRTNITLSMNNTQGLVAVPATPLPSTTLTTAASLIGQLPTVVVRPRRTLVPKARKPIKPVLSAGVGLVALLCLIAIAAAQFLAPTPAAVPPVLPGEMCAVPVQPLFNGVDLRGWRRRGSSDESIWTVEQGRICNSPRGPDSSYLLTEQEFGEFEVSFQYRWLAPGGHTIFYVRAEEAATGVDGLCVNLGDDEGFPAVHGRPIGADYQTGSLQGLVTNPISRNKPLGEWNTYQMLVTANSIEIRHNGVITAHVNVKDARKKFPRNRWLKMQHGRLALRSHLGKIEYRDIVIRVLSSPPT